MTTSNAVRFLSDGAGDDTALAIQMFLGTVLEAFYANTILYNQAFGDSGVTTDNATGIGAPAIMVKQIMSGKSHQFILVADSSDPQYHTPGVELLGQNYAFDEGTVTIDDILVAHNDVPIDQVALAHWDTIGPLARGQGRTLARDFDRKAFITAFNAAVTASATKVVGGETFTLHNGGNVVDRVNATVAGAYPVSATGARNVRDDLEQLAQLLDDDNVPKSNRQLVTTNYIMRVLLQDTTIFDQQITVGQPNSLNQRVVRTIAGFTLVGTTNNLPSTAITADSFGGSVPSKYQGDFTTSGANGTPVAIALCGADEGKAPVAALAAGNELGPIYAVQQRDERRNTWFLKSQMMVGLGTHYVPSAGALTVSAS